MAETFDPNRRLVAVTATGPIYLETADIAVLSIPVALALIQELALKTLDPRARVSSSLAKRVRGDDARQAWARTCGSAVAKLPNLSPTSRLKYLDDVMRYVRRQKNANGIEPVLCAAINAAWPWMRSAALARVLAVANRYLHTSAYAKKVSIPVFDCNTRTVTIFDPGSLEQIDPDDWIDPRIFRVPVANPSGRGGAGRDPGMGGLTGVGVPGGQMGIDLSGYGGPNLGGGRDPGMGGLTGVGVPGGQMGIDLSGYGGPNVGGGRDPSMGGLSGPGVPGVNGPDMSSVGGPNLSGGGDPGFGGLSGLGVPGHSLDLSNIRGSGGPFGFGSQLGSGGEFTPEDADQNAAKDMKAFGLGFMAVGGAAIVGGSLAPAGGQYVATAGAAVVIIGIGMFVTGAVIDYAITKDKPATPSSPAPASDKPAPQPAPQDDTAIGIRVARPPATPAPPPTGGTPAPSPSPAPNEPKPGDPKPSDLYPDPDGGGGGPTRLPDQAGGGRTTSMWDEGGHGGNPKTIWDENGGGGNPTTIWDENGHGGNPTTRPKFDRSVVADGRGLLATIAQVGPNVFVL
jgi:hypothetical protein